MASYDKQYGATPTDEYGNPIRRTDEYGNPVGPRVDEYGNPLGHHTATTGTTTGAGGYAPHDFAATTAAGQGQGVHGHDYDRKEHHGVTGAVLHRSGSSSSSSVSPLFLFSSNNISNYGNLICSIAQYILYHIHLEQK